MYPKNDGKLEDMVKHPKGNNLVMYGLVGLVLLAMGFFVLNNYIYQQKQGKSESVVVEVETKQPLFGTWRENSETGHYEKPSDKELEDKLPQVAYWVTQKNGTETPFRNEYFDFHGEGIYVDVVSGEPLFSSKDKFDSGTGWPSFTRPMTDEFVVEEEDSLLGYVRTEIRSKLSNSHLGHVFDDGPEELGGLRYCMNSAALRFVPVEEMSQQGYGEYLVFVE